MLHFYHITSGFPLFARGKKGGRLGGRPPDVHLHVRHNGSTAYSVRKASTGSFFAAALDGKNPATIVSAMLPAISSRA